MQYLGNFWTNFSAIFFLHFLGGARRAILRDFAAKERQESSGVSPTNNSADSIMPANQSRQTGLGHVRVLVGRGAYRCLPVVEISRSGKTVIARRENRSGRKKYLRFGINEIHYGPCGRGRFRGRALRATLCQS